MYCIFCVSYGCKIDDVVFLIFLVYFEFWGELELLIVVGILIFFLGLEMI